MRVPLAVTLGEPAGIGPDITIAAWATRRELDLPPFYVVGDARLFQRRGRRMGLSIPVRETAPMEAADVFAHALPVVELGLDVATRSRHPDQAGARAAILSIERATADVLDGLAAALVTNPIAKSVLYAQGFSAPGHTEFLAQLVQRRIGRQARSVMMLWCDELAVVPITIHTPLKDVPRELTCDLIVETGRIVAHDLKARFGVGRPRLAVSGLNPHAGENGTIGDEEETVIAPAIERLRAAGFDVRGPLAADSMFYPKARATYDAALTAYHDQALIPIKTIAFERAVNVTLGLPVVRTSPDHGTAFNLAGTGKANPSSFIAALRLAARLSERRAEPDEPT